jgi:ABC-type nitrate/sulfonate/bicarbonate transport system ATPase subunit
MVGTPLNRSDTSLLLTIEALSVTYREKAVEALALDNVSLAVAAGQCVAIVGPSGCGKSTLFNVLAGLLAPSQGTIALEGNPVAHIRGKIAYMQQKDLLLPWRSAIDNAILGMELQGVARKAARRQAREMLTLFGLQGAEHRYPHELSGGMRQRVALMRTMLCKKPILLLDEPFGALDAITRSSMQQWLLKIWKQFHPTVLLVTHDVEEALVLADRIYVMTAAPGTVRTAVAIDLPRPRLATDAALVARKAEILALLSTETNGGGP